MIKLENIERRYASDEVETTALVDVNLEVAEGEFLAIMGPSGCGKSSTLRMIAGHESVTDGDAQPLGHRETQDHISRSDFVPAGSGIESLEAPVSPHELHPNFARPST